MRDACDAAASASVRLHPSPSPNLHPSPSPCYHVPCRSSFSLLLHRRYLHVRPYTLYYTRHSSTPRTTRCGLAASAFVIERGHLCLAWVVQLAACCASSRSKSTGHGAPSRTGGARGAAQPCTHLLQVRYMCVWCGCGCRLSYADRWRPKLCNVSIGWSAGLLPSEALRAPPSSRRPRQPATAFDSGSGGRKGVSNPSS
jgi:hypothetical protein